MHNVREGFSIFEREQFDAAQQYRAAAWFTITAKMVVLGFIDILDRFGDNHVPKSDNGSCIYMTKTTSNALVPVCIVGQLFHDWGILGTLMLDPNGTGGIIGGSDVCNFSNIASSAVGLGKRGVYINEDAYYLLIKAQEAQDNGDTWGRAVDIALTKAAEFGLFFVGPDRTRLDMARDWQNNL